MCIRVVCVLCFSWSAVAATPQKFIVVKEKNSLLALDRYHRAFDIKEAEENAVYTLRNTRLRELLRTRKEIIQFLGGIERARQVSLNKNLRYTFARRTCELYLQDCDPDKINVGMEIISESERTLYVKSPLYEIYKDISDIYTKESKLNQDARHKLIYGLVHLSAILSKLDRYLSYFQRDVWRQMPQIEECGEEQQGKDYAFYRHVGWSNCRLLYKQESKDIVAMLTKFKNSLISRYAILVIKVKYDSRSSPLYRLIYRKLEGVGFPLLKAPLTPNYDSEGMLPWPRYFEQHLAASLEAIERNIDDRKRVFPAISTYLDRALLKALEANTDALAALGKDIHYHPRKAKHLLALTRDSQLWQKASDTYAYLSPVIDFQAVQQVIATRQAGEKNKLASRKKITTTVAIGAGVLGLLGSISLPPFLRKRPILASVSWLVGGSIYTYEELSDYLRNNPLTGDIVNNFKGNIFNDYSYDEFKAAKRLRSNDTYSLAFSLLLLGMDLVYLHKLGVFDGVYLLVKDSKVATFLANRRETVKSAVAFHINKSKGGMKIFFQRLRDGTHAVKNPHLNRALQHVSKISGVPRHVLDKTLYQFVSREKLVAAIKLRTGNKYFRHLLNNTGTSLGHLTLMEFKHYGEDIVHNLDQVAVDYISSVFISVMLTWINFGRQPTIFKGVFGKTRGDTVITLQDRASALKTLTGKSTVVGFAGTLPAVSIVELRKASNGETTSRDAWRNILTMSVFGAVYIGTLSNIRTQFLREVRRAFGNREGLHFILNNTNSLMGQWFWIKMKDVTNAYKRTEVVGTDAYYLVKGIVPEGENNMFDFMNRDEFPRMEFKALDKESN